MNLVLFTGVLQMVGLLPNMSNPISFADTVKREIDMLKDDLPLPRYTPQKIRGKGDLPVRSEVKSKVNAAVAARTAEAARVAADRAANEARKESARKEAAEKLAKEAEEVARQFRTKRDAELAEAARVAEEARLVEEAKAVEEILVMDTREEIFARPRESVVFHALGMLVQRLVERHDWPSRLRYDSALQNAVVRRVYVGGKNVSAIGYDLQKRKLTRRIGQSGSKCVIYQLEDVRCAAAGHGKVSDIEIREEDFDDVLREAYGSNLERLDKARAAVAIWNEEPALALPMVQEAKPQVPDPKPQVPDPEPQVPDPEPRRVVTMTFAELTDLIDGRVKAAIAEERAATRQLIDERLREVLPEELTELVDVAMEAAFTRKTG